MAINTQIPHHARMPRLLVSSAGGPGHHYSNTLIGDCASFAAAGRASRPLAVPTKSRSVSPAPDNSVSPLEQEIEERQFAQSSWSMFRRLERAGLVGGESNPAILEREEEMKRGLAETRVFSSTDLFAMDFDTRTPRARPRPCAPAPPLPGQQSSVDPELPPATTTHNSWTSWQASALYISVTPPIAR
eukprot:CAMPEP_0182525284 /NCGR_PEP_ID=MMETSP1323-20130603/2370_1 /TAXON_ID=236787 /ORGANISM="Florenciella parvula, Strain RCC1693" /LENGTH=187 /DNA_ID=CAMNT_0024733985 /DNA_START=270 /DNA_END=831 /DNA_ORIENTATION=+